MDSHKSSRIGKRNQTVSLAFNTDKRRYIRYELLDYAVLKLDGIADTVNVVITDIGLGGLQVRSKSELPLGTKCYATVGCVDDENLILRGEVRHTSPIAGSDLFATGIRFVPDTHEERMSIAEFVHQIFQRQADQLSS